MISRAMIYEKIGDLLTMEGRAFELYKGSLQYPESAKYGDKLNKIMNDELRHMDLVKRIMKILS